MSGLGAGLARGLAAYGQGRMIADERDYRRAQDELQRKRQEQQDAAAAAREQRMMEQLTATMQRQKEQDGIAAEERTNRYRADGFRPVEEANATGQALGAGAGFASAGGAFGAAGGALAQYGQAMQDGAKRPDATVGGRGMVKTGESLVERVQRLQAQQRDGERIQSQQFTVERDTARNQQALALNNQQFRQQQALQGQRLSAAAAGAAAQPPKASLPTVDERKAAALYSVAKQGYSTLEGLLTSVDNMGKPVMGKDGTPVYKGAPSLKDKVLQTLGGNVGNVLTSDQQRQMTQAANQMADMWLRYTSGAAVPETEVARFAQTFTPLPGDDPQTLRQKAAARKTMLEALKGGAGRALNTPASEGNSSGNPLEDPGFRDFLQSKGISP